VPLLLIETQRRHTMRRAHGRDVGELSAKRTDKFCGDFPQAYAQDRLRIIRLIVTLAECLRGTTNLKSV
jgi:hypothetical protein